MHTQLVLHSATLQGEGGESRWEGLGDAIDQVREWRDVCTVNSGLLAKLQELQFTDESFGPMEFNDSHVKCTSLQFVVNTNHMKVASDSIGPCDGHVT